MDVVWLARLQFSLTIMFHFLFPPITIGLAFLIFLLETRALAHGEGRLPPGLRLLARGSSP